MRPSAGSGVSLSMEVTSSALLQAWISIGFRGKVKVSDSAVIQLWNSSDVAVDISSAFVFDIVGCNARAVTDLATNVEESRSSVFSDDEKIDPSRMIFGMIDEVDYTEAPEQRFFREISRN
jgi:hypothetical protein